MTELTLAMLRTPELYDYDLIISDSFQSVRLQTHSIVLRVSSPFFKTQLVGKNYLGYEWKVPDGHVDAAIALIQYFYTCDLKSLAGHCREAHTLTYQLQLSKLQAELVDILKLYTPPVQKKRHRLILTRSLRAMRTRNKS